MSQVGFLRSQGTTLLRQGDGWIIGDINFQQTSRMYPALPLPQQPLRQNLSKPPRPWTKLYTALISTHKPYFRSSWATLANLLFARMGVCGSELLFRKLGVDLKFLFVYGLCRQKEMKGWYDRCIYHSATADWENPLKRKTELLCERKSFLKLWKIESRNGYADLI